MASEYRNPYSKKYSKVTEKELHTVIPFTKNLKTPEAWGGVRAETDVLTKEYVAKFNADIESFESVMQNLTMKKREMTANQRKALKKIERGARTIADFKSSKEGADAFALARLKSGMEELLGGLSTMQKYNLLDEEYGIANHPADYAQGIYDLTAEYGQIIFQTGRRFNKELSKSNKLLYAYRLNQIDTLRKAYRQVGQTVQESPRYARRMDITLAALVSATLHCNITEAVERVELYRQYEGGPDVDEMTWDDFYNFAMGAYPQMQRDLDEQRAKEEEHRRKVDEVQRMIDISVAMRHILDANYAFYTGEHFEEGIYTDEDLVTKYTDENKHRWLTIFNELSQYPEAWNKINQSIAYLGDCLLNPLASFAKAISTMRVGTDLGLSFTDILGFPLASLMFELNLSMTSVDMLSKLTSVSTSFLIGSVSKLGSLLSGKGDDDEDGGGSGPSKFSKNHPVISGVMKLILNVVSIGLKAMAIGFSAVSSLISTAFSMFTGLLSSMLKMLKEIFKTSQIMEAVSNILSLCLTLFFLPFFTSFGNALLEAVFNILLWTRDNGMSFIEEHGNDYIEIFQAIGDFFIDNKENLMKIATEFIEIVCVMLIALAPDFMEFVGYMVDAFLDNKDVMFQMLSEGINVGNQLLQNNIFGMYMYYGTLFMSFIDTNADWIKSMFDMASGLVDSCLGAFSWIMDHMLLFCIAVGGAIGSLTALAGVAGLSRKLIEDILMEGVKRLGPIFLKFSGPVIKEYMKGTAFKAFMAGGLTGSAIGILLYSLFFSFGRGGYIPSTPGGLLAIVAEKETEYIIPESKMHLIRGHNNIVLSFNDDVYMLDNPTSEIKTIATQVTQTSHYR